MSTNTDDEKIDDIVNRMAKKKTSEKKQTDDINYDDVEFDKLDDSTRKSYADLFQGLPDVYKIIGAKSEDSQITINKKCAEKLKKYQPDRHSELVKKYPEDERPKQLKKLNIQYSLIRDACTVLRDTKKRKYYDLQKNTIQNKNFISTKNNFEEFKKLQESKINEKTRKLAKNNFELAFLDLDKKHGFDRNEFNEAALTTEETNRRYEDLQFARTQEEIEYAPRDKFEGKAFSQGEFNKNWAKYVKKEKKRKGELGGDDSLMVWEGISASNDYGTAGGTDYVGIDNYEDLYMDKNHNSSSKFASRLDSDSEMGSDLGSDVSEDDLEFDIHDAHDKNKDLTMNKYDEMLQRREQENDDYDRRELHDKKAWKSVYDNPMNISAGMGDILGRKDFKQIEGPRKTKTIGKEYADVYKQLIHEDEELIKEKKKPLTKSKDLTGIKVSKPTKTLKPKKRSSSS